MIDGKMLAHNESVVFTSQAISVRMRKILLPIILIAIDYCAIAAAVWTAFFCRGFIVPGLFSNVQPEFGVPGLYLYLVIPFAYILFMHFDNLYARRLLFWQQVGKIFKVSVYAIISVVVLMYLTGDAKGISRIFIVLVWGASIGYLIISKILFRRILTIAGLWQVPAILIGAGKTAEMLVNAFNRDRGLGYKVVGLVEDNRRASSLTQYPVIGTFDRAEEAVRRSGVKDILIAAPGLPREELLELVYRLQPYVDNITFVPDLFGIPVVDMEIDTLFNEKAVLLRIRNNLANEYNRIIKRIFDLTVSLLGLIFIIPLLAIICLLIYVNDPGPVIFAHKRIGRGGKTFSCYKFRSMVVDAQQALELHFKDNPAARAEWEQDFKLKNDPRVTPIGDFLRRTSLDELPQLFNVIKGEMSLVGPRPIVNQEVSKYGKFIYDYYLVRPGITGMWQVSGRNDVDYDERVQLDSWYVRNWSLWLDVILLTKTFRVVLKRKGAY